MATKAQVNNFIDKLSALAVAEVDKRKAEGKRWSLASICIAQSALETGWGTSNLMVKANAFFGIKATESWKGKVYSAETSECYDGVNYTNIKALFRAYDSLEESVKDYFDLICNSDRYSGAVREEDANKCITAIKNGGYATAHNYIDAVMSIVNQYDLTRFDKKNQNVNSAKTIEELAKEVIAGLWGNGLSRKTALTNAGYNYDDVQAKVDELLNGKKTESVLKPINEIALEVISGKWGNGNARKSALIKAGYNYDEVQTKVDELLKGTSSTTVTKKSVDEIAKEVIKGLWGNGAERKKKLESAGYKYIEVQVAVNKLLSK